MKTKNNLLTGIIIGICVIVLPLILMGTTNYTTENDDVGRYQVSTCWGAVGLIDAVFETIIDSKTGEVVSRRRVYDKNYQRVGKKE
tara:strand:- start:445 stop:702 length:258 start_codon:yes stop_codon:yes gene_type:complete